MNNQGGMGWHQGLFSSLISAFSTYALFAALIFCLIDLTYSDMMTWNLGESLLVEAMLRPDFLRARTICLSAFWKWAGQKEGTVDLSIGFPQSIGPVVELKPAITTDKRKKMYQQRNHLPGN